MKKQLSISLLLTLLLSMTGIKAYAHDFEVANADGQTIYYVYNNGSDGTTVSVSCRGDNYWTYSDEYSGDIVIPESVTYNEKIYSVTSIGYEAFQNCSGLTSVAIGSGVTTIGSSAFQNCSGLTSVTIGSGVTTIGSSAFSWTNLKKTIWLCNTPPSGYTNASGTVNYVSNNNFSSLSNVKVYQFLSSLFEVDGIKYVPVSPSERTCDAIDCVYNETAADTKILSTVTYKGISLTVKNIQPYIAYNNKYIENLTLDNEGAIADYAFNNCNKMKTASIGERITSSATV